MGKNQSRLMRFALSYPGWHSCGADSRRAMRSLEALGLLIVRGNQFRAATPEWTLKPLTHLPQGEQEVVCNRVAANIYGRASEFLRKAENGDDAGARFELQDLLKFFPKGA